MPSHYLDFEPDWQPVSADRNRCDAEYKVRRDAELAMREAAAVADEINNEKKVA